MVAEPAGKLVLRKLACRERKDRHHQFRLRREFLWRLPTPHHLASGHHLPAQLRFGGNQPNIIWRINHGQRIANLPAEVCEHFLWQNAPGGVADAGDRQRLG